MSDDEVDTELLELLRQSLGISSNREDELSSDTGVLRDAEYIYSNAIDVSIDMWSTKSAAKKIWKIMQDRNWSANAWAEHELHPSVGKDFDEIDLVNFVFTMDLLNFSFWSELGEQDRFQVEYQGRRWTGYMSLVASLRRALAESIPITTPRFWRSAACTDNLIKHVFRSATSEQMPLLESRIAILREAGAAMEVYDDLPQEPPMQLATGAIEHRSRQIPAIDESQDLSSSKTDVVMTANTAVVGNVSRDITSVNEQTDDDVPEESFHPAATAANAIGRDEEYASSIHNVQPDRSVQHLIAEADHSAGKLVNLVVAKIPSFNDSCRYEGRKVRLLKRAQIFVADLYGAFQGQGLGSFQDIGHLTMFADYRVPQVLHSMGLLTYCPALEAHVRRGDIIPSQSSWEVQLRGCSIYATELLRREIIRNDESARNVNAVLIDFLLYDLAKEKEFQAIEGSMPHHRTRSTNY